MVSNIVPFNPQEAAAILERLLAQGDLSRLTHYERAEYYLRVCDSAGLNPYTQPFAYINIQNKQTRQNELKLYALKGCTDQLRKLHGISVAESSDREWRNLYIAKVKVVRPACGRTDEDIGAVNIAGLSGDVLANAIMKAQTKAKRRATLGICGLGLLDETEVEAIPGAQKVDEDWKPWEPVAAPAARVVDNARRAIGEPRMVSEPPKRRLARDRRLQDRFEEVIRNQDRLSRPKPSKPVLVRKDGDPIYDDRNPPPIDEIPDGRWR